MNCLRCCSCLQYEQQHAAGDKRAAKELDFLAHLVHVAQPAAGDNFKLNLFFDGDDFSDEPAGTSTTSSSSKPAKQQQQHLEFGSGGRNEAYIKACRLGDVLEQVQLEDNPAGSKGVGEDLLDLMDSVA
jgi:hypothetical protein